MKKAYRKPEAKVVDFSYDTQVTATSPGTIIPSGTDIRPDNPVYCQFFEWMGVCRIMASPSLGCTNPLPNLTSLE